MHFSSMNSRNPIELMPRKLKELNVTGFYAKASAGFDWFSKSLSKAHENAEKETQKNHLCVKNLVLTKTRVEENEVREKKRENKKLTFWIANQVVWHIVQIMQTDFDSYRSRIVMHRQLKISYSLSYCRWKSRPIDERLISMLC